MDEPSHGWQGPGRQRSESGIQDQWEPLMGPLLPSIAIDESWSRSSTGSPITNDYLMDIPVRAVVVRVAVEWSGTDARTKHIRQKDRFSVDYVQCWSDWPRP
ncbi:hypothetical protein GQ607_009434 [Colletotrichum asianum]|uniref:Uncharacterized protein n=1 Tax=Colletotrichum asianum TaxID=702518 RepID=A0A8H3WCN8_9PEZI|nr:hypothetical protein GQ607_009434 [Colletotrichum asianum]